MAYKSTSEHINAIATRDNYEEMLNRAMQVITNDLNSSPRHFLLELLQNADDNKYDEPHPTLTLVYTSTHHLRVHCNERGFSSEDVEAICDVNNSTKLASAITTGEKGIGFKSLFRVASAVWIASGKYQFKLRRDNSLKPEEFQLPFPDGYCAEESGTHIYLEVLEGKAQEVRAAVEQFDPTNILFLKNVERINIKVYDIPEKQILRSTEAIRNGVSHIKITEDGRPSLHYKHFNFPVNLKVARSSRRGAGDSYIKLAFPVTDDFQRVVRRDEKVYACLPIADFGFKFAIHADFIVTANREGIHGDIEWNQQLRDAIPGKIAEAVELINQYDSSLCYSWPLLLASLPSSAEFFRTTGARVVMELRRRHILKTETGSLVTPTDLRLVRFPTRWRFGPENELPIPSSASDYKLLSHMYDVECTELLGILGVFELSKHGFWTSFKTFANVQKKIGDQSEIWHIMLAKMLNNDHDLRSYFCDLEIIPVEGNTVSWVSSAAHGRDLFISTAHDVISLPQGIGVLFVPRASFQNKDREQLFKEYGAREMSELVDTIARKIRAKHSAFEQEPPDSSETTRKALISHVSFLFRNRKEVMVPEKLWVATDSGGIQLASATFVRPLQAVRVPVLHQEYLKGLSEQNSEELLAWMIETFKMPTISRLVICDGTAFSLSPEIEFIAQNCDSLVFLDLLRQNWVTSSELFTPGRRFQETLRDRLVAIKIHCLDQGHHPLHKTLLPSDAFDIPKRIGPLPLLPIPQDSHLEWQFLSNLGVKLRPTLDDWLQYLTDMRENTTGEPEETLKMVSHIYSKIEEHCEKPGDQEKIKMVRKQFQTRDLIFIPFTQSSRLVRKRTWARAAQCILQGPETLPLRHSFSLADYPEYIRHRDFFLKVVKVEKTWDLKRLRQEAEELSREDLDNRRTATTRDNIVELLVQMSQEISRNGGLKHVSKEELDALRRCSMLPICFPKSGLYFDRLVAAAGSEEWFIADRKILLDSFSPEAPLLAFSVSQTDACAQLLTLLGLGDRRLSNVAVALSTAKQTEDDAHASRLMKRARYIDRLVSKDHSNKKVLLFGDVKIKAFSSNVVSVRWDVHAHQGTYSGTVNNRQAVACLQEKVLSIYVQKDSFQSPRTLMEIAGDISDIFRIPSKRQLLVQYIIAQDDTDEIEEILDKNRVPRLSTQEHSPLERSKEAGTLSTDEEENGSKTGTKKQKKKKLSDDLEIERDHSAAKPLPTRQKAKPQNSQTNVPFSGIPKKVHESRQKKLEKLSVSRRLQETTVEELLLNSRLPLAQMAEEMLESTENSSSGASDTSSLDSNSSHIKEPRASAGKEYSKPTDSRHREHRKAKESRKLSRMMEQEKSEHRNRRLAAQFSGSLEASMLFRQSAQTNTFYVNHHEHLMDLDPNGSSGSGMRVLEARLCIPEDQDAERALYALIPMPKDAISKDLEFIGQAWVSQLFSNRVGPAYRPEKHWRSPLRTRLYPHVRLAPRTQSNSQLPFEILDENGCRAMTKFLVEKSFTVAKSWKRHPPLYHISVATTSEACDSYFEMEEPHFVKAHEYRIREGEQYPHHVFIFVRIFNVNSTNKDQPPKAAFYIDPWKMYSEGHMHATPRHGKYSVSFEGDPSFFVSHVERHGYKWKKLKGDATIRLLRLEQGQGSDRLEGSFELCDLDSDDSKRLKYTALSYVWGGSLKQFSLHMAQPLRRRPIHIQTSLYLALRRLRRKDRAVLLWADAICIDQGSGLEKAKQIPLMDRIYQSAGKVLAWLGEEEDESAEAMDLLRDVGQTVLDFRGKIEGSDNPRAFTSKNPNFLPRANDRKWVAVGNLLKRPWFTRVWIVQEAVFATELIMWCGSKSMPWEILHAAAAFCFAREWWGHNLECPIADPRTQKNILQLGNLRDQSLKSGQDSTYDFMFNLLQLFHQREATKPRDRLFALLGLAKDKSEDDLRANYDNSEEDVIAKYSSVFVKQGHELELLSQARMAWERPGLASWMPKLTERTYPKTLTAWGERAGHLEFERRLNKEFKAAGDRSRTKNGATVEKNSVLCLKGYNVDEVTMLGRSASNTDDVISFIQEIFEFVDRVYHSMSSEERAEVRCRLPIGDTHEPVTPTWNPEDKVGEPDDRKATRTDAYVNMLRYLVFRRDERSKVEAAAIREAGQAAYIVSDAGLVRRRMWPYYQTVIEFAESFQPASAVVCETKKGRVGIVPQTACGPMRKRLGDKIVIFQGAKVPYIIRESARTPGAYQAVGECYIDGIMHGELFNDSKQTSRLRLQEFRLE